MLACMFSQSRETSAINSLEKSWISGTPFVDALREVPDAGEFEM